MANFCGSFGNQLDVHALLKASPREINIVALR
jgi:hypothetical protein